MALEGEAAKLVPAPLDLDRDRRDGVHPVGSAAALARRSVQEDAPPLEVAHEPRRGVGRGLHRRADRGVASDLRNVQPVDPNLAAPVRPLGLPVRAVPVVPEAEALQPVPDDRGERADEGRQNLDGGAARFAHEQFDDARREPERYVVGDPDLLRDPGRVNWVWRPPVDGESAEVVPHSDPVEDGRTDLTPAMEMHARFGGRGRAAEEVGHGQFGQPVQVEFGFGGQIDPLVPDPEAECVARSGDQRIVEGQPEHSGEHAERVARAVP